MSKTALIGILAVVLVGGAWVLWSRTAPQEPASMTQSESGLERDGAVVTDDVAYHDGTTGYYAAPAEAGTYPGVVMIHEWWGLNENIKQMAEELAAEGYQVLAVDLYGGEVATTPDRARTLSGGIDQTAALANLSAAADYLRTAGAPEVASLGWCFGGGQSLQLSLADEPLDATIIYYGRLVTDTTQLRSIDGPVLGIFGAEDTSIPVANVEAFEAALNTLTVQNEIYVYPGVGHAFANPSGDNFAPEETADAWNKTLEFLRTHLQSA